MAITARRRQFCREYIKDHNATQAYKRAGYTANGQAAHSCAYDILSNTEVKAYIAQLEAEQAQRLGLRADEILKAHVRIAKADPADFFAEDGSALTVKEIPKRARMAIQGISVRQAKARPGEGEEPADVITYRLCDRQASLKELAKYTKMPEDFSAPTKVDVTSGGEPLRSVDERRGTFLGLLAVLEAKAASIQESESRMLTEGES